ncbi:leucine-rich_repeat domain-containing protein [Hexamita inflata]|uniref:Leucine-rich repeat domain-containing protein n=1 Tax=Hexamita inflata TaxID=28002 RepID=A0AA86P5N2_9EUKA|nr:leucine-rich repeat domain-containing protein [Hexamita inflata]CAI9931131.1 leucine-rich repeat domain-containing protein [Hexamita inflata]
MEEQIVNNEIFYCVRYDTNLMDKQIDKVANMKVNQLYYPSINRIPVHITKLIASDCCLQEITGVRLMKSLTYLDISNNYIKNISDLQYLQNLQYLNMTNNKVIFSQPLSILNKLQQLYLASNMIHDFGALASNQNFSIGWICPQNDAFRRNFMEYLGPSSTIEQATTLMTATIVERDQNPYHNPMLQKYAPLVINKMLIINNNQELCDIKFTELMNIDTLFVVECYNLNLEQASTNLLKLVINMCSIQNISGLENMTSIIELSLRGNKISEIVVLSKISTLQKLDLAQNNIISTQGLENLTQLTDVDLSNNNITDISSLKSMKQLKSINLSKNKIQTAQDLDALINLEVINLSYNNINNIIFVKRMNKLVQLDVSFNQVDNIDVIKNLANIVDLRLDGNRIKLFNALESLSNINWSWYTSEQQTQESDQTRMIIKECLKHPVGTNFKFSDNTSLKQLGFIDIFKSQELTIINCPNISFENCPHIPINLQINKCGLQTIEGIFQMQQIVQLDIGFNNVRSVSELEALTNLQVLNLQNNDIYRINALSSLKKLKYVNVTNNKIIFSQPLKQMLGKLIIDNNLVTDNMTLKNQNVPQLVDYQNFLGPNSTEDHVKELTRIIPFDQYYNQQMQQKHFRTVSNQTLKIVDEQALTDFGFTSLTNIQCLNIQNCRNVKLPACISYLQTDNIVLFNYPEVILNKIPIQITQLTMNNCNLTNVLGIQNLKQLLYLNLKNNRIISIQQLQQLTNLKQVHIDNNYIYDFEYLNNQDWICQQNIPTDIDIQAYLTDINSSLTIDAFKTHIIPLKIRSNQLFQQAQYKYNTNMLNKYQNEVNYKKLEIFSDTDVKNINFMDLLSVECLILNQCINLSFRSAPTQLLYLTLNDCDITQLDGLQQFQQLKKLELIQNTQLQSIKQVYSLLNLLSLTINDTNLTNLIGIKSLTNLKYIDLRNNCIVSIEPLKSLQHLKQVLIDNNIIQDMEHLTSTQNYNSDWIQYQREASDTDLARFIVETNQNISLQEFKTSFEQKKCRTALLIQEFPTAYNTKMKEKYKNKVYTGGSYGPYLYIERDQELRDIHFVSELSVKHLFLNGCLNAHLLRAPTNLRCLMHYNGAIKTAKGVERIIGLEALDLEGNQIIELNISRFEKLDELWVRTNKIMDFSVIEHLKAKGCCKEECRTDGQMKPKQKLIDEARLW